MHVNAADSKSIRVSISLASTIPAKSSIASHLRPGRALCKSFKTDKTKLPVGLFHHLSRSFVSDWISAYAMSQMSLPLDGLCFDGSMFLPIWVFMYCGNATWGRRHLYAAGALVWVQSWVSGNSQCRVSTNKREIALLIIRETRMLKRERV
ncbi:hypothetical protein HBI47_034930 [Parastagonospora nodorum]|nr:hypothetical protein HBI47_034930 [Parastagonospora nodorum]